LIKKWLAENSQYIVQENGIRFRPLCNFKYAHVVATDSSGKVVEIVLRLSQKYVRGFIEAAVVESIKEHSNEGQ